MLHGAERVFPSKSATKSNSSFSAPASNENCSEAKAGSETSGFPSVIESKGLLQIVRVRLETDGKCEYTLALCDSACTHSWMSKKLAEKLNLKGTPVQVTVRGINTKEVLSTHSVRVNMKPADPENDETFQLEPYLKEDLNVGSDVIDVVSLQAKYPHL